MNTPECRFEPEVLDAVVAGRWPDSVAQELREHAAGCANCAELSEVAAAVRESFERGRAEAAVPAPGLVWWRSQLRMRREAAATARRRSLTVEVAIVTILAVAAAAVLIPIFTLHPGVLVRTIGLVHGALPWVAALACVLAALAVVPVLGLRGRG